MSVIVVLRIPGNPADLESYAAGPGGQVLSGISAEAKALGAIRHTFAAGDNEIIVIDEWPDAQTFESFFNGQPEIPSVMASAGAQGPPQTSIYRKLDTPDQF
jgi:hypothetical protein